MASPGTLEVLRRHLCDLESHIQNIICTARDHSLDGLSDVSSVTRSDTIYHIDKISESALLKWFETHWPGDQPVELVMEGLEDHGPHTFPPGTPPERCLWKCIIDPIDGTRSIMYDKRPAWILAGIAPWKGEANTLQDIVVSAMTEIPTSKQTLADQLSAIKGGGSEQVQMHRIELRTGKRTPLNFQPSRATDLKHGFASFVKFFPEAKELTARLEEALFRRLGVAGEGCSALVFDDQYLTTGGQLYEVIAGRDRFLADLRPLTLPVVGQPAALACHPYDICTALIATELGVIVEKPDGSPMDAPLDTTTPVAWVAYANETLAAAIRPILRELISGLKPVTKV